MQRDVMTSGLLILSATVYNDLNPSLDVTCKVVSPILVIQYTHSSECYILEYSPRNC